MRLTSVEQQNFRIWLQSEFSGRCKKNGRYSLRAFGKFLAVDPSSLSQIMAGKRPVSGRAVDALATKLGAKPVDRRNFGLDRSEGAERIAAIDAPLTDYYQLGVDTFAAVSDWQHYAILELTFVDGFNSDPKWIAKKLSITVDEAKSSIERLLRLGLLLKRREKKNASLLIKAIRFHTNAGKVLTDTSAAHRELQRQLIAKSLLAIDQTPAEDKDITSITMAIDVANLDRARKLIQKFRRDLCDLLEDGNQTRIYNLAIQLVPISEDSKTKGAL